MNTVKPLTGLAPYLGGKRNLATRIVALIENIPHKAYAEPFVGMGGIFLRRPNKAHAEYINDRSNEVTSLFKVLQRHYPEFKRTLAYMVTSRAAFKDYLDTPPGVLTDIERAARFFYLQKTAFGGKICGRAFGVDRTSSGRFNIDKLEDQLQQFHKRLAGVTIECLDYKEFIQRYDTPETLFYLDPPYFGNESDYGQGMFNRAEFEAMAQLLAGIQGKFILSLNDKPEVRQIFSAFNVTGVETTYSISKAQSQKVGEVLISNAA